MSKPSLLILVSHSDHLVSWAEAADKAGYEVEWIHLTTPEDLVLDDLVRAFTVVVEWLPVHGQFKEQILRQLETVLDEETLILSSAHAEHATSLAAKLSVPNRLVGFSPLGTVRDSNARVTLAPALQTGKAARGQADRFFRDIQVQTSWVKDTPGMVMPRIYAMLANEAAYALQSGVASAEDIDIAMHLGTNYPMGPLAWADSVGIDIVVNILNHLWDTYREERYRPCLLLQQMCLAGQLGQRTGQGFFTYPVPIEEDRPERLISEQSPVS